MLPLVFSSRRLFLSIPSHLVALASMSWTGITSGALAFPFDHSASTTTSKTSTTTANRIQKMNLPGSDTCDTGTDQERQQELLQLRQHPMALGTYCMDRELVQEALMNAVELGYRRIDCAPVYFNEDVVGDALQQILAQHAPNLSRADFLITSKLAGPFHRPEHVEPAVRKTLSDLRLDYLDLLLIHWPVAFFPVPIPDYQDTSLRGWPDQEIDNSDGGRNIDPSVSIHETWQAMEKLVDQGLVRSIGVSNFPVMLLHELLSRARIPPSVNQCERHPYLQQNKLMAYCRAREVHFQAYSPLGTPGVKEAHEPAVLEDDVLKDIAKQHNATTAQICLAWALRQGTSVVVKSVQKSRLAENWAARNIELTEEDLQRISADRNYRFFRPEEWWGSMAMAVFD